MEYSWCGVLNKGTWVFGKGCLGRDHRTTKKFISNPDACKARADKGKTRGSSFLTRRMETHLKIQMRKHPLQSSTNLFAAIGFQNVPKTTRCRVLKRLGTCSKPIVQPPLKPNHHVRRVAWAGMSAGQLWMVLMVGKQDGA